MPNHCAKERDISKLILKGKYKLVIKNQPHGLKHSYERGLHIHTHQRVFSLPLPLSLALLPSLPSLTFLYFLSPSPLPYLSISLSPHLWFHASSKITVSAMLQTVMERLSSLCTPLLYPTSAHCRGRILPDSVCVCDFLVDRR